MNRGAIRYSHTRFGFFIALLLLLAAIIATQPGTTAIADDVPIHWLKLDPALREMIDNPTETTIQIIVQKTDDSPLAEEIVSSAGGTVTKDLPIVNGFAATVPITAIPTLSQAAEIRYISYDGPVRTSQGSDVMFALDEFDVRSYSNNHGNYDWLGPWVEIGENDGPTTGLVKVSNSQQSLRFKEGSVSIQRGIDLSAAPSAILSFNYRPYELDDASDYVILEISADAGNSWVELDRITGPANESEYLSAIHNISQYATGQTYLRFTSSPNAGR